MKQKHTGPLMWMIIFTLVSVNGWAGFFSKKPPAEFLNLETCGGYSEYSCTLKEFAEKAFISTFSRSWDDDGNGGWILLLTGLDKGSGKNIRVTITFEKMQNEKGTFANPIRINNDGQDLPPALIPNLYIPMVEKAGQVTGKKWKAQSNPSKKDSGVLEAERQTKAQNDEIDALQAKAQKVMDAEDAKRKRETEEGQKKKSAAEKKQASGILTSLIGHYKNRSAPSEELEISGQPAGFSLSMSKPQCKFTGKPIAVEYDSYRELSVGTVKQGECQLTLLFQHMTIGGQDDDAASFDTSQGDCNALCKNADLYLNGDFRKRHAK